MSLSGCSTTRSARPLGVGLLRAVRLRQAAAGALGRARASLTRLEAGITLLAEDPQARQAFAFTNRAMALQRRNTQAAQRRERDAALNYRDALAVVNEQGPAAARSEACTCLISNETGQPDAVSIDCPVATKLSQAAIYPSHWARLSHLSESPGLDHPR